MKVSAGIYFCTCTGMFLVDNQLGPLRGCGNSILVGLLSHFPISLIF